MVIISRIRDDTQWDVILHSSLYNSSRGSPIIVMGGEPCIRRCGSITLSGGT